MELKADKNVLVDAAGEGPWRHVAMVDALASHDHNAEIAAEIARRWNACAGIDTAALTPGLVGEMVEALVNAEWLLRLEGYDHSVTVKSIRAILVKLGK